MENADIQSQTYDKDTIRTFHQLMNDFTKIKPYQIKLNDIYIYFKRIQKGNTKYRLYFFNTTEKDEITFYIENNMTYEEDSVTNSEKKVEFKTKILYYIIKISQESENKIYFVLKKPSSLNLPKFIILQKMLKMIIF